MPLPAEYRAALEEPPPATLVAMITPGGDVPTLEDAIACAGQLPDVLEVIPVEENEIEGTEWEILVRMAGHDPEDVATLRAWLEPAPADLLFDGVDWRGVTSGDISEGRESAWAVVVSTSFEGPSLREFHRMVRLLAAVAPDTVVVYDVDALTPRPGHWLHEVAAARTPPSPATLFTIHDVIPEASDHLHWLHTHGLARCAALELDVLGVPDGGTGLMGQLLNAVASLFMERGIPDPNEPFLAGQDLELVWLPWEEAMRFVPEHAAGSARDRDDAHRGARGVLLRPKRGARDLHYDSPATYLPLLEENPLLYVSEVETERMMLLASERLPRYLRLLARFGDSAGWTFLVKLGYPVDGADTPYDREHLWFEVHAYEAGEVDATLLNQPYRIARMHEGKRERHSLDRLSDWTVLGPHGRFDANSIAILERLLVESPGAH